MRSMTIQFRSCMLLLLLSVLADIARADLQAGAAKVDITPPMGVSMDGPISKPGPATSVHDPLHARALVLDNSGTRIGIVVCDATAIGQDVFDSAKEILHQEHGWSTSQLLMSATHTHATPRLVHVSREPQDDAYHHRAAELIAEAVVQATQRLSPAQLGYATFDRGDLLACRRFLCESGTVEPNPFGDSGETIKSVSGRSSGIIEPAGPVDPQFSILSVRHVDGQPLCLLGNFSVHYCGGYEKGAVSADYFGYFCQAIESQLSSNEAHPPMVGIMSNGTSGNTGSFQGYTQKFAPFEGMQHFGRSLADDALRAIDAIVYQRDIPLSMLETEIELGVRRPSTERLAWAKELLSNDQARGPHAWSRIYANETLHLSEFPATRKLKLQAMRLGDVAIAACPCEVFAETGLAIKHDSPFKKTFTIELANGYGGYLPPRSQHDLGGYETWPARSSYLEINAELKIRETLVQLLEQLAE